MKTRRLFAAALALTLVATSVPVRAAMEATDKEWDGSQPPEGVYFHWYEPSFYTGFAPRTQDPTRLHIELSRGNQVRVTMVLGPAELDHYLSDIEERHAIYREMVGAGVLVLTTNNALDRFNAAYEKAGVAGAAAARGTDASRQKAVEILKELNPGRVFVISMPIDRIAAAWHAVLTGGLGDADARLDAANAALPGRVNLTSLTPALDAALDRAAAAAASGADAPAFRAATEAFVTQATNGHYAVKNGRVEAVEFTTIYPAGTAEATTFYKGEKLPDFGVTGVWPLIKRTQGRGILGMVDYLSPNPGYGFITMLPYQHAGGITYNAFHNAGVRCQLNSTPFLPSAWRKVASERDGKPYQNLWIIARGPTSHGCTRLASGHMNELRQIVPSEQEQLLELDTFRNLPGCYDAFDVDGDGKLEVMGVQYYLVFRSNDHTPVQAYVANRREPYYRWLYGDNVALGDVGKTRIKEVPVCRFTGRKAEERTVLRDLPLYEPPMAPEPMQFYRIKPVPFDSGPGFELNREIRKIGAGHTLDRKKLFLK